MTRMPTLLVLAATAAALAVAGCGGGSGSSSTPASTPAQTTASGGGSSSAGSAKTKLSLAADASGKLAFNKKTLSAKSGTVTITMDNPSSLPHAIAVTGNGVNQSGSTVTKGGKSTVTVKLKPGTYTFYCPVDGHRAAGMHGTLTIQ